MRIEPFFVATLLAAAPACTSPESSTPPPLEPTFQNVVEQVLTPKCTFGQCHNTMKAAAELDLTADFACSAVVDKPSCLFPNRLRVRPGHPDESFFFHKLTGEGLDAPPAGDCGLGAQNVTNHRMPLGGSGLEDDELALVRAWIADGAVCSGKPGQDVDPAISSITADRVAPLAGQLVSITVTLDKPAPAGGQELAIEVDPSVLSAPTQRVVPESATSIRFDAYALRPTSRFALRVRTTASTKQIVLRVAGLEIAEVLFNPVGGDDQLQWIKLRNRSTLALDLTGYKLQAGQDSYDLVTVPLAGSIPPGSCAVIGGPISSSANGQPVFLQPVDFAPDLPYTGNQATGFAVFDDTAVPLGGIATPVDTMLVGASNASLLDQDGGIVPPYCATGGGSSVRRTGANTCEPGSMQPNGC